MGVEGRSIAQRAFHGRCPTDKRRAVLRVTQTSGRILDERQKRLLGGRYLRDHARMLEVLAKA